MFLASLAARAVRSVLGAVLGLGLAAGLALAPAHALAREAAPAWSPPAQGGGPALWVIRDADSTIYLYGTVHVLRPSTLWRWAGVEEAFDSAPDVWLEVSNPDDQAALVPLVRQYGLAPDRPLSSLLTPAENAELGEAARAAGVTAAQLDGFRPWLAGLTLSVAPLTKAGYDPASGVELTLAARARAAGKTVHGFETIDRQVRLLAEMPEADQLAFLRGTLDAFDDATTDLDRLVERWSRGDVDAVRRLGVDDVRAQGPGVYQTLLVRRNTDWAGQIQHLLAGSGTVFIAVGAGHLAGPDSVQAILRRRGVQVSTATRQVASPAA